MLGSLEPTEERVAWQLWPGELHLRCETFLGSYISQYYQSQLIDCQYLRLQTLLKSATVSQSLRIFSNLVLKLLVKIHWQKNKDFLKKDKNLAW